MSGPRSEIRALAGDLLVTAGAGAGKTTCLVDTYVSILTGDWSGEPLEPDQIVAITFTEKAADEMKARVVARLAQMAAENPGGRDWANVLAKVEWSFICTIHSFCASLLREFGAALGLDPDFRVLDAEAFDELAYDQAETMLREMLATGEPRLKRLLAGFSLGKGHGLQSIILDIYKSLSTMGLEPEQALAQTEQRHREAMGSGPELVASLALEAEQAIALRQGELASSKAKFAAKMDALTAGWPMWRPRLEQDPQDSVALAELGDTFSGFWGKLANPHRQNAVAIIQELQELKALPQALEASRDLLALTDQFSQRLERELLRRSSLSFDHLLNLSVKLIQTKPGVLAETRSRWRVIMVDEFQDVNQVQGRLVELLASADGEQAKPRLLLVGDRKQSIYAFRGADVSVYNRTMQEFPAIGGRVLALERNFRSKPDLVSFFNDIFRETFRPGDLEEKAPGAFVTFLPGDGQRAGKEWPPGSSPVVDLIKLDAEKGIPAATLRGMEAEALAAHIKALLADGCGPGEIVILLRKLSQVDIYEKALANAGLDCYTVRGRGFYSTREVVDMLAALKLALDPSDDLYLAQFLRSPMVGLSDETLFSLAYLDDRRTSLSGALLGDAVLADWLDTAQHRRWEKARRLIGELAPLARRISPADLITRILEATRFIPVLLGTAGGEQKAANLRKLLEMSRGGRLGQCIEDFVENLDALVQDPTQEPQAALMGEDAGVVRIMTIHQAKGLQFKVTILADLAGKQGGGIRAGGVPELGPNGLLSVKYLDPHTGERLGNPVYRDIQDFHRAREAAESARLFYVACTRAEERLVFCQSGAPRQNTWSQWVADYVEPYPGVNLLQRLADSGGGGDPKNRPDTWPDGIPSEPGPQEELGRALVANCLNKKTLPSLDGVLIQESVSALEDFFTCPRKYYFTGILGLDTALSGNYQDGSTEGNVTLGSLVHNLLETVDFQRKDSLAALADAAETMGLDGVESKEAIAIAARFWETGLTESLSGLESAFILRERGFKVLLPATEDCPGLVYRGELDLVMPHPHDANRLLIVDYKVTGNLSAEKYRDQLGLYALALWLGGGQNNLPPSTALCFLNKSGAHLEPIDFTRNDLLAYRDRLYLAAKAIAAAYPEPELIDFEPSPGCPEHCALFRSGICPGFEVDAS